MQKHTRAVTILSSHETVVSRRKRDRDTTEMNVIERLCMISKLPIKAPLKDRVGFNGQNTSNGVGPVPMANLKDALKLTWAEKKKMMGANIRRVGGAFGADCSAESDADPSSKVQPRKDDDEEFAFYHSMADEWYHPFVGGSLLHR